MTVRRVSLSPALQTHTSTGEDRVQREEVEARALQRQEQGVRAVKCVEVPLRLAGHLLPSSTPHPDANISRNNKTNNSRCPRPVNVPGE